MLQISKGKQSRAQKIVLYGTEGIGKSTLASCMPDPLFIDTEGGTAQMDVRRFVPKDYTDLLSSIQEVARTPGICKTLVLDTADWAEQSCIRDVCARYKKTGVEDFGYGKGYTYVAEEFQKLLKALDSVIEAGIHVMVTAHAKMRKIELPDEMGAFDHYEMKLSKQVAPLLKEWADLVLFANYKTYVVTTDTNSKKAQGGKRVMYTTHHTCWDAKNRHGLPDELPLDYRAIAHLFEDGAPTQQTSAPQSAPPVAELQAPAEPPTELPEEPPKPTPLDALRELMREAEISEYEVQDVVASKGHFAADVPLKQYPEEFITQWLLPNWEKIAAVITADPTRLPF